MLKSIAIMTSGGDSPGMNAAARAVVRTALYEGVKVFGIYDGYKGMLEDRIVELNSQSVSDIIQRGGTFLGTARCPEFKQEETRKEALKLLANKAYEDTAKGISKAGEYLGTTYYTNDVRADKVVTTRVRQIVDYVDNDGIFSAELNNAKDHSWKNTNVTELTGSGYGSDKLLSDVITTEYELIDKKGIAYITDQRNNVILSIDTQENTDQMNNSGFEAKLVPYKENADAYKSQIVLTITKTVSAEDDANNLNYDNIAEIVKIENSVGRRDIVAVPGNANPTLGEFEVALKERDSSATELVTFTPPTGIN